METLTSDPTLWAGSLGKTARLLDLDGLVVGLDFTLLAEASGCRIAWEQDRPRILPLQGGVRGAPEGAGRMRHALEAARRLFGTLRSEFACMAALTGPATLAGQLFGRQEGPNRAKEVKPLLVRAVEAFCATRPDVLVLLEDGPGWAAPSADHRRIYNTLANIAAHYDVRLGLYLQGVGSEEAAAFSQLKADIYILGPAEAQPIPSPRDLWRLGQGAVAVGLGIPLDDLDLAREVIGEGERLCRDRAGPGFFLTSIGPVTRDADLEAVRALAHAIRHL
jgi:hypothetical protein